MQNLMPNHLSVIAAGIIVKHNPKLKDKRDEIRYGLEWMISGMNQVTIALLVSIPFGIYFEAFFTLLSGASLRMFSGGYHASKYIRCLIISTIQILLISFFGKNFTYLFDKYLIVFIFILIFSFGLIWIKSPVLIKKKDLFTKKEKRILKTLSLLTFLFYFCISFAPIIEASKYCIWLSLIVQSLTLINYTGLSIFKRIQ